MRPRDVLAGRDAGLARFRRAVPLVAWASLSACDVTDPPPSTQPAISAHDEYTQHAWPALQYCVGCHGGQPAIDFLAPGEAEGAYETVFRFQPPVINLDSPGASLMLTMGKHTGPPLVPDNAAAILAWLQAERDERAPDGGTPIRIGPVALQLGTMNSIDLGNGAVLHVLPADFDGGLDLSQISITTGATKLHVVHPLFMSRPANAPAVVDEGDRFDGVDLTIDPNSSEPLDSTLFIGFAPTDPITVNFRTLEAAQ
jgi:mono/diheme cytochrome c family protein